MCSARTRGAGIQITGAFRSTLSSVAAAAALSIGASIVGSALWTRHRGSRDVVFADLMIWGWLRRLRTERRLENVSALVGERAQLSPSRRAELLERLSRSWPQRDDEAVAALMERYGIEMDFGSGPVLAARYGLRSEF